MELILLFEKSGLKSAFLFLHLYLKHLKPTQKNMNNNNQTWQAMFHPDTFSEAVMKAGLHHRTHQVFAYTLTSDSLMPVKLWPLAVATCRLPRPLKSKDMMKDGERRAELGGFYVDVLTVTDCQCEGSCQDTPTCVLRSAKEQLLCAKLPVVTSQSMWPMAGIVLHLLHIFFFM